MFDIVIKNGTVIDGTGNPMAPADIGIKRGKIASIDESIPETKGKQVIDASGHYVTPGFIDIQNHSDTYWTVFLAPQMESLIYQGVTTVMCGKCGSSLAPLVAPNVIESIHKWADLENMQPNWATMKEYLAVLEQQKLSVNFATMVGHTTLRYGILGNTVREATVDEVKAMKKQLEDAMDEGGFGLSTGLNFAPSNSDPTELLIELAKTASQRGGTYATHMRSESREVIKAVQEAITIGREANIPVQISHIKSKEEKNWGKMDEVLQTIDAAQAQGIDVTFDVYPYTATGSVLSIYLPDEAFRGGTQALLKRLRNPAEVANTIIPKMKEMGNDYTNIQVAYAKGSPQFVGRYIVDIAQEIGQTPEETIVDIIVATENVCLCFNTIRLEENIVMSLQSKHCMIGSGGPGYSADLAQNQTNLIHPRSFGTFARTLQYYVRENSILTWEDAIHKMTGKSAEKVGLEKRGLIKKKYFADIAIINPNEIAEKANFENPYRYAAGVKAVIVNGEITMMDGEHSGIRAGEILRF